MGQTLTNGIYLPAEGERNCYEGLAANWTALDGMIGGYNVHISNATIHVTAADKQAWNGKADASALTAHTGDTTIHVTAEDKQAWNGKADASALTAHTGDTTIHVTASDKQTWNGKQDALSQTQLDAVNSGIDSTKVQQIATNTSDIISLQSGKANDSNVVHKSGNETVGGEKTFTSDIIRGTASNNITIQKKNIIGNYTASTTGSDSSSFLSIIATLSYSDSTPSKSVSVSLYVVENAYSTGKFFAFRPSSNNLVDLGTNSKKWANVFATNYYYGSNNVEFSTKFVTTDTAQTISGNKTFSSINGVEPSSLSLPSGNVSNVIDISSYIVNLDGTTNSYTVPANGWISIAVVGTAIAIVSSSWSDSRLRASSGDVRMLYPVLKNETLTISIVATTLAYARFIPCRGNV